MILATTDNRTGSVFKKEDQAGDTMRAYEDITSIEAEISGYRRSCLRATIDLDRKMIAWNDSLQWNNNFLRSLSPDCLIRVQSLLINTHLLEWDTRYSETTEKENANQMPCSEEWSLSVTFKDGFVFTSSGCKRYPPDWRAFRDLIECAVRVPFRLK
jgi:hypothetical protein